MDRELRDLERTFEATPSSLVAEQLARALLRQGKWTPPRVLGLTERWKPLVAFVARWFEKPIEDGDGCTEPELRDAEQRIGRALPVALREWYQLVGARLELVQDRPVPLEKLKVHLTQGEPLATVWSENQYGWEINVSFGGDDVDPPVFLETRGECGRLVETLLGMVLSDSFAGAAFVGARRRGPLGRLSETVDGGWVEEKGNSIPAWLHPIQEPLSVFPNIQGVWGDETTFVRTSQGLRGGLEWMTATKEAFDSLASVFALDERPLELHATSPKLV